MAGPCGGSGWQAHDIPADVLIQIVRAAGGPAPARPRARAARGDARRQVSARDGAVLSRPVGSARLDAALRDAARSGLSPALTLYEDGRSLEAPTIAALRVSLPSDRSFADFETARAHFRQPPLPPDTAVPWNQALFDVALEYRHRLRRGPSSRSIRRSPASASAS